NGVDYTFDVSREPLFYEAIRVPRLQLALLQRRIVLADGLVEERFARHIECVIDAVNPGHIGAEADLAGHVHRNVYAQMRVTRDRINQTPEGSLAGQRVIVGFGEILRWYAGFRYSLDGAGNVLREKSC